MYDYRLLSKYMRPIALAICAISIAAVCTGCGGSTAAPTHSGIINMTVACQSVGADPLACTAHLSCTLSPCVPGSPDDVTQLANWTSADASVVTIAAPGLVHAVSGGNTFVRATWQGYSSDMRPVSVFAGGPPVPTFEIDGTVYQNGLTPSAGAIDGALVEIRSGLVTGRTATSGIPPTLIPGYLGSTVGPGYYRLIGIPPGSYLLRITKDGYASQETTVTVFSDGGPIANFALDKS